MKDATKPISSNLQKGAIKWVTQRVEIVMDQADFMIENQVKPLIVELVMEVAVIKICGQQIVGDVVIKLFTKLEQIPQNFVRSVATLSSQKSAHRWAAAIQLNTR